MQQIIAMGGGGFLMEPENPVLDRYILEQTGKPEPRICFLPQASAENDGSIVAFYQRFLSLRARPVHLSLFKPHTADLAGFLLDQDVIYVGGGNTKSMLALWREWGIDQILRQAWEAGIVLAGVSAGAICWFEQGVTDSIPGALTPLPCLGFLPGSACPHYDGEADRRPSYRNMVASGEILPGYAMDDYAAAHFVEASLKQVVASQEGAAAYSLKRNGSDYREIRIEAKSLHHLDA